MVEALLRHRDDHSRVLRSFREGLHNSFGHLRQQRHLESRRLPPSVVPKGTGCICSWRTIRPVRWVSLRGLKRNPPRALLEHTLPSLKADDLAIGRKDRERSMSKPQLSRCGVEDRDHHPNRRGSRIPERRAPCHIKRVSWTYCISIRPRRESPGREPAARQGVRHEESILDGPRTGRSIFGRCPG